ncbi:MAG: hypothetical protein OXC81_03195 [Betaproteobacteria bacterium]|nr:hypothetical protein [Betaproteobacteria bacterium]
MAEIVSGTAAAVADFRPVAEDVFLRRLPAEYLQPGLPSTVAHERLAAAANLSQPANKVADPQLREALRYEAHDRAAIASHNFADRLIDCHAWCDRLAGSGDSEAGEVAQVLDQAKELAEQLIAARNLVIYC